jgi:integrase
VPHPERLVFTDSEGGPIRKSNLLRRNYKPLLKQAGLPPATRFHDLRHSAATLLLAQGVHPKIVQERLGHSTITLTLDTYSHVLEGMQREAATKLDAILGA